MEKQDEVRVAWGTGIAGHVAESGEPVNIPDAYQVNNSHRIKMNTKFIVIFRIFSLLFFLFLSFGFRKTISHETEAHNIQFEIVLFELQIET